MISQLPESANLEHLKGQAKSLLFSLRSGDPDSLTRISGLPIQAPFRLAHTQLVLAREYGFESWAKLKRHLSDFPERRTGFFAAIRAGDKPMVRQFLAADRALAHSHDPDHFGAVPMYAAMNRDDPGMIDLLLEYGADINARSDWWAGGFGPLDTSSEELTSYLISRGATLTPHAAARLGMAAELREVIARNPEVVFERGGDGQFPLHYSKTPEIVDILLDAGAEIDARDVDHEGTPLQHRILDEAVARRLVERGATHDVFSATVLGDLPALSRLLDEDSEALTRRTDEPGNPWVPQAPGRHFYIYNIGSRQPHQVATHFKQDAVYDLLWERSSPDLRLAMAGWRADRDAAFEVVAANPGLVESMTIPQMQMLPAAAWERRIGTVKLLLEVGFNVNAANDEIMTATANAAFHGFDDVIEAILPYGPDLTIKNCYGGTPLGTCLYGSLNGWRKDGNYARCVELLIEAGSPLPEKLGGNSEAQEVLERSGVKQCS